MNKYISEMLIGVLLGDASIRKTGANKAYISFEQSSAKKDYLLHLFHEMKSNGFELKEQPTEYTRTDPRYNSKNSSLQFRTKSIESLKPLADLFLDENGKKIIPANIKEHLTQRGLAYWIMDDGQQVKRGGITLCTDSFNSNEISILRESLSSLFDLRTSIHAKKSKNGELVYERIYISKLSLDAIKPELKKHMHETMLYKLNIKTPI